MWTSLENATATRASFAHKPRYFEFGCLWACGFAKKWESVDSKSLLRLLVCVPACVCVYVCEGALWQAAINRHAGAFMCVSVRICAWWMYLQCIGCMWHVSCCHLIWCCIMLTWVERKVIKCTKVGCERTSTDKRTICLDLHSHMAAAGVHTYKYVRVGVHALCPTLRSSLFRGYELRVLSYFCVMSTDIKRS